jgi:hypothetical protein
LTNARQTADRNDDRDERRGTGEKEREMIPTALELAELQRQTARYRRFVAWYLMKDPALEWPGRERTLALARRRVEECQAAEGAAWGLVK